MGLVKRLFLEPCCFPKPLHSPCCYTKLDLAILGEVFFVFLVLVAGGFVLVSLWVGFFFFCLVDGFGSFFVCLNLGDHGTAIRHSITTL